MEKNIVWILSLLLLLLIPIVPTKATVQNYSVTINTAKHNEYGMTYPLTYIFTIPSGSGYKAYKRYSAVEEWVQLTEKLSTEVFSGIECVRFDYSNNKAYVSIAFTDGSDEIQLKLASSTDSVLSTSFDSVASYYDNSKCAVTTSQDDYSGGTSLTQCNLGIDMCQAKGIWNTVGVVTDLTGGGWDYPNWSDLQSQINQGFVEVASHGARHEELPYTDYDLEISGSKTHLTSNLTLPSLQTKGSTEYIYTWLEPFGTSDTTQRTKCGLAKYLPDRDISTDNTWATWDTTNGLYNRIGYSIRMGSDGEESASILNSNFDARYTNGEIYHLQFHALYVDWSGGQYADTHLSYIDGRTDVWYVGLGHLYLYHYTSSLVQVDTLAVTNGNGEPIGDGLDIINEILPTIITLSVLMMVVNMLDKLGKMASGEEKRQ